MFNNDDDYEYEEDDTPTSDSDYSIMLGFSDVSNLIQFIQWVNDNFDDPEDLHEWFDEKIVEQSNHTSIRGLAGDDPSFTCTLCDSTFSTSAGLLVHQKNLHKDNLQDDPFWNLIRNSFINHQTGVTDDGLSGST